MVILHTYLPVKMEQTECSETLAYKIQTPGNYPEENIQLLILLFLNFVLLTMHLDIIVQRKTNLVHNLFLVYFINLDMFWAYLGPSSGGTTVCI
jgi:hypothetical protein